MLNRNKTSANGRGDIEVADGGSWTGEGNSFAKPGGLWGRLFG